MAALKEMRRKVTPVMRKGKLPSDTVVGRMKYHQLWHQIEFLRETKKQFVSETTQSVVFRRERDDEMGSKMVSIERGGKKKQLKIDKGLLHLFLGVNSQILAIFDYIEFLMELVEKDKVGGGELYCLATEFKTYVTLRVAGIPHEQCDVTALYYSLIDIRL